MGRYVSSGSTQTGTNQCLQYTPLGCYQTNCQKYAYSANDCWQNKLTVDSPGSYSFVVPKTSNLAFTCIRFVGVGGGGKSWCTCSGCYGWAGAGGAYAEKWDCVCAGCTVTMTVGRQEATTTFSYTNALGNARTVTAGGASGPTPGSASGGDWNSSGGCGGYNCNYCGGSVSHYCGSCQYLCFVACCGYCLVYSGVSARQPDPDHGSNDCCVARYAGGASAGSWIREKGGDGVTASNSYAQFGQGYGISVGGGGGIGYITRQPIRSHWCTCICHKESYNTTTWGEKLRNMCCMSATAGGGGSKYQCCDNCTCQHYQGTCQNMRVKNGHGGWGGFDNDEGRGQEYYNFMSYGANFHGEGAATVIRPQGSAPRFYPWHDIHSMCGSGSSGKGTFQTICSPNSGFVSNMWDTHPDNAGEGAGTGGVGSFCCDLQYFTGSCCLNGVDAYALFNWSLICCLGTSGRICCADKMMTAIAPYIFACAGTLGGAGGFAYCNGAQKAGKGGGSGINRQYLLCICYGGAYDCCNQVASTPLAFPPSELDWRLSPAGTGMALIYWKD